MSDLQKTCPDPGLDFPGHNALLTVSDNAYTYIFISQKNRPNGMEYFDFVMSELK
jgi:hypothetical protein